MFLLATMLFSRILKSWVLFTASIIACSVTMGNLLNFSAWTFSIVKEVLNGQKWAIAYDRLRNNNSKKASNISSSSYNSSFNTCLAQISWEGTSIYRSLLLCHPKLHPINPISYLYVLIWIPPLARAWKFPGHEADNAILMACLPGNSLWPIQVS